jgi:pimeloyl-ACP methyl ester carboxylesterase
VSSYFLIHGGAHGAWCWEPLLARLEAPMLSIDLPGRGRRPAPLDIQTYASFIASAEADMLAHDMRDIVIVAHSMGGITAIGLLQRLPERIRHCVFIAAPIPAEGTSIGQFMQRRAQLSRARTHAHSAVESGIANAGLAEILFHDLNPDDRQRCLSRVTAESIAVYNEPVSLAGLAGAVPRTYIKTLHDRGLPPPLQDESISRIPRVKVKTIETGHTAMYADPDGLARLLEEARTSRPDA